MRIFLNEIGDGSSNSFKWVKKHSEYDGYTDYIFTTDKGTDYKVNVLNDDNMLEVAFDTNNGFGLTNKNEVFTVMATIVDIIKSHLNEHPEVNVLTFSPDKRNSSDKARESLYIAYINKLLPGSKIVKSDKEGFNDVYVKLKENVTPLNEDKIKGGKSDKVSIKDIADKFGLTKSNIERELKLGVDIEFEHTNSKKVAKEIAMDHLVEFPDYYTRLVKMEKKAKSDWKSKEKGLKESVRDYITTLVRLNLK